MLEKKLGAKRPDHINGRQVAVIQLELVLDSEYSFSTKLEVLIWDISNKREVENIVPRS